MDLTMGKIWPTLNFSVCRARTVGPGRYRCHFLRCHVQGFDQCVAHGRLQVPQQEHCNVAGCVSWWHFLPQNMFLSVLQEKGNPVLWQVVMGSAQL